MKLTSTGWFVLLALMTLAPGIAPAQQQGAMTTGGTGGTLISVTGKVVLEDGQPPPEKVEIQLVCDTQAQTQGKTDSAGNFSAYLGVDRFVGSSSASTSSGAAAGTGTSFGSSSTARGGAQAPGASIVALAGCGLRAVLQGYRSETIDLSRRALGDSPKVGTIVLYKIGQVQGLTVSKTTLSAPKNARSAFEKAQEHIAARRLPDAEKELRKAVELYPKYAEAWHDLGAVLQAQNKAAEARKAFLEAVAADDKYVVPYLSLARLSATEKNWPDTLDRTTTLLRLDPYSYPQAYYYRAVAQYNLNDFDGATDSARQAVKLDTAHATPLAEQLLGMLLLRKEDYTSAAEQFRNYMQHVPPTANLQTVKALLAEAESGTAKGRGVTAPQP
jgi:tetratricopeptide (TPR) repeat protein